MTSSSWMTPLPCHCSFPQVFSIRFPICTSGKKQYFETQVLTVTAVSGAGLPAPALPAVLGWQHHGRAMTQCLAEAGRGGSSPQPAAEQAQLCAGHLKRSFMTSLSAA